MPVSVTTKMPCPFVTVTMPARSKCTLLAAIRIVFGAGVPGGACGLSVPVTCSNSKSPPSVMPPTVISSPSALTRMVCAGIAGEVDATGVVLISSVNVPGLIETPGRVKASAHVSALAVAVAARSSVRVVDVGAAWITYVALPILMFLPMSAAEKFPDAAVNVVSPLVVWPSVPLFARVTVNEATRPAGETSNDALGMLISSGPSASRTGAVPPSVTTRFPLALRVKAIGPESSSPNRLIVMSPEKDCVGSGTVPEATTKSPWSANCSAPVVLNLTRTVPESVTPGMPTTWTVPTALNARPPPVSIA